MGAVKQAIIRQGSKHFSFSRVTVVFVPIRNYHYSSRAGLSEHQMRRRLEQDSWRVWRGGLIDVLRKEEVYPNVRKRYELLCALLLRDFGREKLEDLQYLCFQHGMPDFICNRGKEWKFVECKLGHEQLSKRQKLCIQKLQELGFVVEVHKLVEPCTKTRVAEIDVLTGRKHVLEKEMTLGAFA